MKFNELEDTDQIVTKQYLQVQFDRLENERKRRENETKHEEVMAKYHRFNKYMGYGMAALYGIIAGGILTTCATHYKP